MIQHCVEKMQQAEIHDVLVITGGDHFGAIAEFLGSGKNFGCRFTYRVQDEAGGIAQALGLAEGFIQSNDTMCVLLGDNIFALTMKTITNAWVGRQDSADAMVVLKEVEHPERFGVVQFGKKGEIIAIQEKPSVPLSNMAVTGIYFYDGSVFSVIRNLKPSARGELEITDVNNFYVREKKMVYFNMVGEEQWWTDAGTHESYIHANRLVTRWQN